MKSSITLMRVLPTSSWYLWAPRRDNCGYSAIIIVWAFQSELIWVLQSIFKRARSGELHLLCENSALSGCGVSRRNPIFGDVIVMTEACYSFCCSPAYSRLPSGYGGCR